MYKGLALDLHMYSKRCEIKNVSKAFEIEKNKPTALRKIIEVSLETVRRDRSKISNFEN